LTVKIGKAFDSVERSKDKIIAGSFYAWGHMLRLATAGALVNDYTDLE
jgi:hypothetical protein